MNDIPLFKLLSILFVSTFIFIGVIVYINNEHDFDMAKEGLEQKIYVQGLNSWTIWVRPDSQNSD